MPRVVADANVLISAALARSPHAPSVLTLAKASNAQAIISGDLDLLAIDPADLAVEILTPRQFAERLD